MENEILKIWTDLHLELRKFVLSKVKDEEACNDILQDIFIKIQLHVHTLDDSSKLTSWVFQVTRNTVTDYFRKKSMQARVIHLQADHYEPIGNESEEPLYQSLSSCINSKISQLPGKYRQAILLTSFKDYSQRTLASELNISYSGAKTRVQRAREKLKDMILDCKNVETDSKGNPTGYEGK